MLKGFKPVLRSPFLKMEKGLLRNQRAKNKANRNKVLYV